MGFMTFGSLRDVPDERLDPQPVNAVPRPSGSDFATAWIAFGTVAMV